MPREDRIEAILAAWYEFDECPVPEKSRRRDARDKLVGEATGGTLSSRQELLDAL